MQKEKDQEKTRGGGQGGVGDTLAAQWTSVRICTASSAAQHSMHKAYSSLRTTTTRDSAMNCQHDTTSHNTNEKGEEHKAGIPRTSTANKFPIPIQLFRSPAALD